MAAKRMWTMHVTKLKMKRMRMKMLIDMDFFAAGSLCVIAADKNDSKPFCLFYVDEVDCYTV